MVLDRHSRGHLHIKQPSSTYDQCPYVLRYPTHYLFLLLRIQLMITPMMPGKASAAFIPNLPSSLAKAFCLFLNQCFAPFSSLDGGLPPTAISHHWEAGFNQHTNSYSNGHEYGSDFNTFFSKQCPYLFS